jgi:hypothetical protein
VLRGYSSFLAYRPAHRASRAWLLAALYRPSAIGVVIGVVIVAVVIVAVVIVAVVIVVVWWCRWWWKPARAMRRDALALQGVIVVGQ